MDLKLVDEGSLLRNMDFEKLMELGRGFGYESDELLAFVEKREELAREKETVNNERDERNRERESRKELALSDEKQKHYELELTREQTRCKLELLDKEIQLERVRSRASGDMSSTNDNAGNSSHNSSGGAKMKLPRLPPFEEGKDNLDAYIQRFERFAEIAGWSEDIWAVNLSTLLKGKALEVYSRLSPTNAADYKILKESLLKRFQLTEEGFRHKFRNSKPESGESSSQFVARLENYLDRWMELGDSPKSYDGLRDLLLREQFMMAMGKNLAVFLKERKPETVHEMSVLAEQYNEAHGGFDSSSKLPTGRDTRTLNHSSKFIPAGVDRVREVGRKCYGCGSTAHMVRDCQAKSMGRGSGFIPFDKSREGWRGRGRGRGSGYSRNFESGNSVVEQEETKPKFIASCLIPDESTLEPCCISDCKIHLQCGHELPIVSAACKASADRKPFSGMPVSEGYVGHTKVKVLRDSGCSSAVVRKDLVSTHKFTGRTRLCVLVDGTVRKVDVVAIEVDTPYFVGQIEALCMENPVYDLILGNIYGVRNPGDPNPDWIGGETHFQMRPEESLIQAVETRAQRERNKSQTPSKLHVPAPISDIGVEDVKTHQSQDPALESVRDAAVSGKQTIGRTGNTSRYLIKDGLIYREFQSPKVENGKIFNQLVVPTALRAQVLKLSHDSLFAGHLGVKKMSEKVLTHFFWPGLHSEIMRYCRSCDVCQKTCPKGKVSKVPIGTMPIIDTPFKRVGVDLVGPIHPRTEKGNKYMLTLVDYATRYPEATALKSIEAETVAEALVEMFSRIGVPNEILTDMGTQFTSEVMKEVSNLLSIKQLTTTPYHPACNGLVERFHQTLKRMLRRMSEERPTDWDRYIAPLLFAYREAPQESLGFSPFQLLYGRTVRGPLTILRELWTKELDQTEIKTTYQYVVDLRERLEGTCELARSELRKSTDRYKGYYNKTAKDRQFSVGDKVLLLLPTDHNKLLMQWKGPFEVVQKVGSVDYRVDIKGKLKVYHANMLKKYIEREREAPAQTNSVDRGIIAQVCVGVIEPEEEDGDRDDKNKTVSGKLLLPRFQAKESIQDVQISPELDAQQQHEVRQLLREFSDVLTDLPGSTDVVEHSIKLTAEEPVRSRPYPVPHSLRDSMRSEVKSMLGMGIIEPSNSSYASPVVMVKKPDGSYRFCCDFRKLNKISEFDCEPMSNPEEVFARLSKSKYFTKIDLSKGYWQIPVKESCRHLTAFITSEGLYQFTKMPFGLVGAPACFCRMMRKVLHGMNNIENFVDDILVHTETWQQHGQVLADLFSRLRQAKLTARPTKCLVGYLSLDFVGHVIGNGCMKPNPSKVQSIQECPHPETKKQVRSFLGLIGFYRKYIPNFSSIASPLTELTKKGQPTKVSWGVEQEGAFRNLSQILTQSPVLRLPDCERQFILRTDASDSGLGAVILQEYDGEKFPVAYASKKLLVRERAYSVIERECLAIVWAVQKFQTYLYGQEFILETDHQPLIYLNRAKVANSRIMRWALSLQPYRFRIVAIKGSDNVGADFLSRHAQ